MESIGELKRRDSKYSRPALKQLATPAPWTAPDKRGCQDCTESAACGQGHVYAILLSDDAREHAKMLGENPPENVGGYPLYVGSTSHTVECNFRSGHLRDPGDPYLCSCFTDEPTIRAAKGRVGTTRWTPLRLCYDLLVWQK